MWIMDTNLLSLFLLGVVACLGLQLLNLTDFGPPIFIYFFK